jgi:hypothetical protein
VLGWFWLSGFKNYHWRYRADSIAPIQSKIGALLADPRMQAILGQPKSAFDLRRVMDDGKVLLVNLAKGSSPRRSHRSESASPTEDLVGEGHVIARARSRARGRIVEVRCGGKSENAALTLVLESVEGSGGPIRLLTEPLVIEGERQSRFKRIVRGLAGRSWGDPGEEGGRH